MKILELGYVPFQWMRDFDHDEWHAQFQRDPVKCAYRALVRLIAPRVFHVKRPYLFQREPNLRIHPPGGTAVPWHTDADFGHLPQERNLWIPLTKLTDDTQCLWVNHDDWQPGLGIPIQPVHVPLGSALVFAGARIRHGNEINMTDEPRVSFDFRLILKDHYWDTGAETVLYGVPLRIPEYWEEMTDD